MCGVVRGVAYKTRAKPIDGIVIEGSEFYTLLFFTVVRLIRNILRMGLQLKLYFREVTFKWILLPPGSRIQKKNNPLIPKKETYNLLSHNFELLTVFYSWQSAASIRSGWLQCLPKKIFLTPECVQKVFRPSDFVHIVMCWGFMLKLIEFIFLPHQSTLHTKEWKCTNRILTCINLVEHKI